jgi:hypothetical protein
MNPKPEPLYRYTIFDDNGDEVTAVLAEHCDLDGTVAVFNTGEKLELVFNLGPGYSMIQEEAE